MSTVSWLLTLVVVALIAWMWGYEHCWHRYVAPLRERLKVVEAERELLRVLAFDEPQPERTYDIALVDRLARITGDAQRIEITANTKPEARN